jgi:CRP-like cAMP-binding protein
MTQTHQLGLPDGAAAARFAELLARLPECKTRMLAAQQWLRLERSGTGFHLFLQVGAAAVVSNGTVLALLGPGDCFSTQSEEGTSYLGNCAILSVTPSTWLQLPAARYFAALRQDPELASRAVAAQAEAKIWNMRYQEMLACRHVLRRVVGVATLLLARAGSTCPLVGGRFALLSQATLAALCRLSRQAVNRALAKLRRSRALYSGRNFLCAPDLAITWQLAQGRLHLEPGAAAHCKLRHPEEPLDCLPAMR